MGVELPSLEGGEDKRRQLFLGCAEEDGVPSSHGDRGHAVPVEVSNLHGEDLVVQTVDEVSLFAGLGHRCFATCGFVVAFILVFLVFLQCWEAVAEGSAVAVPPRVDGTVHGDSSRTERTCCDMGSDLIAESCHSFRRANVVCVLWGWGWGEAVCVCGGRGVRECIRDD